jgi:hypothetical protein
LYHSALSGVIILFYFLCTVAECFQLTLSLEVLNLFKIEFRKVEGPILPEIWKTIKPAFNLENFKILSVVLVGTFTIYKVPFLIVVGGLAFIFHDFYSFFKRAYLAYKAG